VREIRSQGSVRGAPRKRRPYRDPQSESWSLTRMSFRVFWKAIDFKMGLTAGEFTRYVKHMHTVERDMFDVVETSFDEPSWLR
jgi:hypothetical protein